MTPAPGFRVICGRNLTPTRALPLRGGGLGWGRQDWDTAQALPDTRSFLSKYMKFRAKKWDFVSQKKGISLHIRGFGGNKGMLIT